LKLDDIAKLLFPRFANKKLSDIVTTYFNLCGILPITFGYDDVCGLTGKMPFNVCDVIESTAAILTN
jgi:hypothetical protein